MRMMFAASVIALCASAPAFAQTMVSQDDPSQSMKPYHQTVHSWPKPVDHGPFTAEASRAYQGGGVVLQGPPGAPPPRAEATPPGQMPRNSVQ
jgi:hypothetical protein